MNGRKSGSSRQQRALLTRDRAARKKTRSYQRVHTKRDVGGSSLADAEEEEVDKEEVDLHKRS